MDRTGAYSGALWLTEFANPYAGGWTARGSAESVETLQHLYWFALTAQAKGCKAVMTYPPWSPASVDASLYGQTMAQAAFWQAWLGQHVQIPVYVMPVPVIVRRIRTYFAAPAIGPALNDPAAVRAKHNLARGLATHLVMNRGSAPDIVQTGRVSLSLRLTAPHEA